MLQHPVIDNLINTGWASGREPEYPICPICGEQAEHFFKVDGENYGCDYDIEKISVDEDYRCPICGGETEYVYVKDGEVIACENPGCDLQIVDAWQEIYS